MRFGWDNQKNAANRRKHGLDFSQAVELFASSFLIWPDVREDYGEERWIAVGEVAGRTVSAAFVERGETIWIISFRKASRQEKELYYRSFED